MSQFKRDDLLTEQQYLILERSRDIKHEYVQGELIAMAGSSPIMGVLLRTSHVK